jgi:hypothetical protein
MMAQRKAVDELLLCIALKHLGEARELVIVKVKGKNRKDYHAFPPFQKRAASCSVDVHTSRHESGRFQLIFKIDGKEPRTQTLNINGAETRSRYKRWKEQRVKPANLIGVAQLHRSVLFLGQFPELPQVGTNKGESVVLDADGAGFCNDAIFLRVYLVAPGSEDRIPVYPYLKARIVHLERRITPWVAIEVFQTAEIGGSKGREQLQEQLREWSELLRQAEES